MSPPEVISSLLSAGTGSAPMLAASAAWDGVATELGSAAQSFSALTSGLAGEAWQGVGSEAMLAAAARYAGALSVAATQAETAAAQAQTVAGAFESALAATVHPALVAANRNQLAQLVVSNLLGQNAPTIAAVEAEYEQMWAQNVTAMVGYYGGASAATAQLTAWSEVQDLLAQVSSAIAGGPVGAALSSVDSAISSSPVGGLLSNAAETVNNDVGQVEEAVIDVVNETSETLIGRPLISTGSSGSTGSAATTNATSAVTTTSTSATVPLTVNGSEAIVYASVGNGSSQPLLVDTGSTGLVVPYQDIGGILGLFSYGLPTGFGIGGYSGGLDYLYVTLNMPINFGGGLVTNSTPVDVELFAWPTSLQALETNGFSFQNYFAHDGVTGVLGVGANASGPSTSSPTQSFSNSYYNEGLLINESAGTLTFGPAPTTLTSIATVTGAPITTLEVSVNGGALQSVSAIIDSGGVDGTLPSSLLGSAGTGSTIAVYTTSGQELYSYALDSTYYPTVTSGGSMNTGYLPFSEYAVYIDYAADTMTFYE